MKGFTLMELLMVVVLIAVVAVTVTVLLFTSLQGSSKAAALATVKQNGDYAIGVIERQTRNSKEARCQVAASQLVLIDYLNSTTTFEIDLNSNRLIYTIDTFPSTYLTSEVLNVSNFLCEITPTTLGEPDVVKVTFNITYTTALGEAYQSVNENFNTKVSLRTY